MQVPFSPLWSRVVVEKQASSLFRALKRIGSLLVHAIFFGGDRYHMVFLPLLAVLAGAVLSPARAP